MAMGMLATTSRRRPREWWWAVGLGAVVLAAFVVRAWLGSVELDAGRFWDERYTLENVAAVLDADQHGPKNAFHPTLAHLPQAVVLGTARSLCRHTALCDDPIVEDGRFTPLAYLLARWLEALFGALSLVALYRIGRRLFGRAEGLTAAALLAMVPWHVRQSAIIKPDILLVLLLLLACEAALWVAQRPVLRRYCAAGVVAGLAAATKYNGYTAGIPLLLGTLAGLRRDPRRLWRLAAAAGVAAVVFVALDPHLLTAPEMLSHDFGRTLRDYARKSARHGTTHAGMLLHAVTSLLSPAFHGPMVGALGLAGLVVLAACAWRRQRPPAEREGRLVIAGFPFVYAALFALTTQNPSAHNWLPLAPFTSLAAAWLAVAVWRRLAVALPVRGRTPAGAAALVLLAAASCAVSVRWVYPQIVPSTVTLAVAFLNRALPADLDGRLAVADGSVVEGVMVKRRRQKLTAVPVPDPAGRRDLRLSTVDATILLDDGVALHEAERGDAPARGSGGEAARHRGAPPVGWSVRRFAPAFLHVRGAPLTVAVRPWQRFAATGLAATPAGELVVPAGLAPARAWLSFVVVSAPGRAAEVGPVRLAGRDLRFYWNHAAGAGQRFVTERVPLPAGRPPWRLTAGRHAGAVSEVRMIVWLPPGTASAGTKPADPP